MSKGWQQFGATAKREGLSLLWSLVYDPVTARIVNFYRHPQKWRRRLMITAIIASCLVLVFVVAMPETAEAGVWGWIGNLVIKGLGYLIAVLNTFLGWILTALGKIFNGVVYKWDWFHQVTIQPPVDRAWVTVRDICNLGFVLILLGIGFATILRVPAYHVKRLIVPFVVALLLINFSKLICGVVVDFCNILMASFAESIIAKGNNYSGAVAQAVGVKGWFDADSFKNASSQGEPDISAKAFFMANLAAFVFMILMIFALFMIILLLISRWVSLMVLTIFSPFAYAAMILPSTKKFASQWWNSFLKRAFYGPAAVFMVWLAIYVLQTVGEDLKKESGDLQNIKGAAGSGGWQNPATITALIIAVIILLKAVTLSQSMGIAGANGITNIGRAAWNKTGVALGRKTLRGAGKLTGGALMAGGGAIAGALGLKKLSSNIQNRLSKSRLLPQRGRDAVRARRDRQMSEAEGKAKGRSSADNRKAFNSRIGSPTERMANAMQVLEDSKNGKLDKPLTGREIKSMQSLFKGSGSERQQAKFRDALMHVDAGAATSHLSGIKKQEAMESHFRKNGYTSQSADALKDPLVAKAAMNAIKDEDLAKGPKEQKDALVEGMEANYKIAEAAKNSATNPKVKAEAEKNQIKALQKIGAASGSMKYGGKDIQAKALNKMTGKQIGKLKADGVDGDTLNKHVSGNMGKLGGISTENPEMAKEFRDEFDKRAEKLEKDIIDKAEKQLAAASSRGTASQAYRDAEANLEKARKGDMSSLSGDDQQFMKQYRRHMGNPVSRA